VLRLEVGYSLYGSDIDEATTPLEAGLEGFVNFDKFFVGREALLKQKAQGLSRQKVAFQVSGRRSPRHHYEIYTGEQQVGSVTSGVFSPMLASGVGIGFVAAGRYPAGTPLAIRHERVSMEATVCELPFFKGGSLRA
jgi:aminomethyltransferase